MPTYPWLYGARVDPDEVAATVRTLRKVGVPYSDEVIAGIPQQLRAEGGEIVTSLKAGGFTAEPDEEIIALISYLQRLGKDGTAAIKAGATKASLP